MKRRHAIIDQLHRLREDFGRAHDFDVRRIAAAIRQREDESPEGIVREPAKQATGQKKASDRAGSQTAQRICSSRPRRIAAMTRGLRLP
jgi:hypothetical protein